MTSLLHGWGAVIPLTRSLNPRARVCMRLGMLALLVGLGLYVAHSAGVGRGRLDSFFNDWLYNALLIGAAAACLARGLVRAERTAWCLPEAAPDR